MLFFFFFRLLYQQQSMWMATFWLSQTTCLYTTIPNMEGGLAALTPQKVRLLLIWKMVGTHLHVFFYLRCFFFCTIFYVDTPPHLLFHIFFSHQSNHPLKKSISISQLLSTRIQSLLNLLLNSLFI